MLDPFVAAPYKKCPKCEEELFGVLSIRMNSYSRRCAKCGYPRGTKDNTTYHLPSLKKKIIYIDQFMISNMVNSLVPDFKKQIDPFYLEVFKKLDRLAKLQLIICPHSNFHQDESELSKYPEEHKRVYELLSHGVSFKNHWEILRLQVMRHFKNWLGNSINPETELTIENVTLGDVHSWQDRIFLTIAYVKDVQQREELGKVKIAAFTELKPAIDYWSKQKDKPFSFFYDSELNHWGPDFSEAYDQWRKDVTSLMAGEQQISPLRAMPSPYAQISQFILQELIKTGKRGEELLDEFHKFVSAESLKNVPYLRICSMAFAKLGLKVSQGLKVDNVQPSYLSDALMISTILPFCDAIFTEKQLCSFFQEPPLNNCLRSMPKIFSVNFKKEFLSYLDDIEKNAPKGHLLLVEQVYGSTWGQPFTKIFGKEE